MEEAEQALRAILSVEVDTLVVPGELGPRVYTLRGEESAYRTLIESMNEGALTITRRMLILFSNRCFARMVGCPLKRVIGTDFTRFLSRADRAAFRQMLGAAEGDDAKIRLVLRGVDGTQTPVQVSVNQGDGGGSRAVPIGLVVTDLTEAQRTETLMRALTHRVVQVQEAERGRVALELHDGITQLICAVLFRSQALLESFEGGSGPLKSDALALRDLASRTAEEVERISHDLRPSILDQLGLVAALRNAVESFSERTGVPSRITCTNMPTRLNIDSELTLYRILQEALRNIEKHADARGVTVSLTQSRLFVQLSVRDDGQGFDTRRRKAGQGPDRVDGLGIAGMRERAAHVGGALSLTSVLKSGTEIRATIPKEAARPRRKASRQARV